MCYLIWHQGHVIKVRGLRWESVLDFSGVPHLFTILDRIGLSYLQLARERSNSEKGQRHNTGFPTFKREGRDWRPRDAGSL